MLHLEFSLVYSLEHLVTMRCFPPLSLSTVNELMIQCGCDPNIFHDFINDVSYKRNSVYWPLNAVFARSTNQGYKI